MKTAATADIEAAKGLLLANCTQKQATLAVSIASRILDREISAI